MTIFFTYFSLRWNTSSLEICCYTIVVWSLFSIRNSSSSRFRGGALQLHVVHAGPCDDPWFVGLGGRGETALWCLGDSSFFFFFGGGAGWGATVDDLFFIPYLSLSNPINPAMNGYISLEKIPAKSQEQKTLNKHFFAFPRPNCLWKALNPPRPPTSQNNAKLEPRLLDGSNGSSIRGRFHARLLPTALHPGEMDRRRSGSWPLAVFSSAARVFCLLVKSGVVVVMVVVVLVVIVVVVVVEVVNSRK